MNNQLLELEELLEAKNHLKKQRNGWIKEFEFFKMTEKLASKISSQKDAPSMPRHLEITIKGYSKLSDLISAKIDEMIAEMDAELAKYQTTKTP
jgi:hypothetical protein